MPEKLKIELSTSKLAPEPNSCTPEMTIVWPSSAPIWNVMLDEPVSIAMPLNVVLLPIVEISAQSCATSDEIDDLSLVDSVPLLYCTARSRTRWSMACTSAIAPSAVCTSEMASCPLRCACWSPPIWARSFSLIARPAESSAARLIR